MDRQRPIPDQVCVLHRMALVSRLLLPRGILCGRSGDLCTVRACFLPSPIRSLAWTSVEHRSGPIGRFQLLYSHWQTRLWVFMRLYRTTEYDLHCYACQCYDDAFDMACLRHTCAACRICDNPRHCERIVLHQYANGGGHLVWLS
jgi:hypothetical protein